MIKPFKRLEGIGNVDLSEWSLRAAEEFEISFSRQFERAVVEAANEVLEIAVGYEVWADFDGLDGSDVPDALAIKIALPLGKELEGPEWLISVDDLMSGVVLMADTYDPKVLRFLADRFKSYSERLEELVPSNPNITNQSSSHGRNHDMA